MIRAKVYMHKIFAGYLERPDDGKGYRFQYDPSYNGPPISLAMPISKGTYEFDIFPPVFDGLLPEGLRLEALLRLKKIDKYDYFSQLVSVGKDLVGAITVEEDRWAQNVVP